MELVFNGQKVKLPNNSESVIGTYRLRMGEKPFLLPKDMEVSKERTLFFILDSMKGVRKSLPRNLDPERLIIYPNTLTMPFADESKRMVEKDGKIVFLDVLDNLLSKVKNPEFDLYLADAEVDDPDIQEALKKFGMHTEIIDRKGHKNKVIAK